MGCNRSHLTSYNNQVNDLKAIIDNKLETLVDYPSKLYTLLSTQLLNDNFRLFILNRWVPSNFENYPIDAKLLSINCLDFLNDLRDIFDFKSCPFKICRALKLFENYLLRGALKKVPVNSSVTDDCSRILFGGEVVDYRHAFEVAEAEV
jgi:hypothetical protein